MNSLPSYGKKIINLDATISHNIDLALKAVNYFSGLVSEKNISVYFPPLNKNDTRSTNNVNFNKISTNKSKNFLSSIISFFSSFIKFIFGMVFIFGVLYFLSTTLSSDKSYAEKEQSATPKIDYESLIKDSPPINSDKLRTHTPSEWSGNQLNNGDSPFKFCFPEERIDGISWIECRNRNDLDAVVCVVDVYTESVIRNVYIKAGNIFRIENIPVGEYKIKAVFGKDWNPNLKSFCGETGFFEKRVSFTTSDRTSDILKINNNENSYSTYTITLYEIFNGNMSQREITESEFFNNR